MIISYRFLLLSQFLAGYLVFFSLASFAAGVSYESYPEARRGVFITTTALGQPGTSGIQFIETGTQDFVVQTDAVLLDGAQANEFRVKTPLPLVVKEGGAPQILEIECTPTQEGIRTATLRLLSNEPNQPQLAYPLGCVGNYKLRPELAFFPLLNSGLRFPQTQPGKSSHTWLSLLNAGANGTTVEVSSVQISGAHAPDFVLKLLDSTATPLTYDDAQLLPAQNFALPGKQFPRQLRLDCTPSALGERTATLSFSSTDPNFPRLSYPLICLSGTAVAPSDILLSNTQITEGDGADTLVGVLSTLDGNVGDTHTYALLPDSAPLFQIATSTSSSGISSRLMLKEIARYDAANPFYQVHLSSTDSSGLTLDKRFNIEVLSKVKFDAEVYSQTQLVNTVDNSETFRLIGIVQPSPAHVGQHARIEVLYVYTDLLGNSVHLPAILIKNGILESNMRFDLFKGSLLYLPGQIEVKLSYTLDSGEVRSDLAKVLTVKPNTPPQDIRLEGQKVTENSPVNTLIGTLSTVDADRGDSFVYALMNNPGQPFGYFQIVGNELRMANSFPVNFEDTRSLNIKVRSIDANGAFFDKDFVIEVVNQIEARISGELFSAGVLLPKVSSTPVTVYGDRPLTLNARILPEPSHIGKTAEVFYEVALTSPDSVLLQNRVVLKSSVSLRERMDYAAFTNIRADLSGAVQIKIGYRLLDTGEEFSEQVANLDLQAKTPLQESWTKLAQPLCSAAYRQPEVLDLNAHPETYQGTNTLLEQINALPLLKEAGLLAQQDKLTGQLLVEVNQQRLAWLPLLLQANDTADTSAAVTLGTRNSLRIRLAGPPALQLIAQPATDDLCALQTALSQQGFTQLQVQNSGDIQIGNASEIFSLRPDLTTTASSNATAGFFPQNDGTALLVYRDAQSTLKQQVFYATPVWGEALLAAVENGLFESPIHLSFDLNAKHYRVIPALKATRGTQATLTPVQISHAGDLNADGIEDLSVQYPNGDRQVFYAVTP